MKKKIQIILLILLFPTLVYAYSNEVIIGGETIGIEVHSNGVYIVGFYKVDGEFIAKKNIRIGDIITKIFEKDEELFFIGKEAKWEKQH